MADPRRTFGSPAESVRIRGGSILVRGKSAPSGSATGPRRYRGGPASDLGGPVADPPGAFFPRTKMDPLRIRADSAAVPKVRRGSATGTRRTRGLKVREKKLVSATFGEHVFASE